LNFDYFKKTLELLKPELKDRFKVKAIGFLVLMLEGSKRIQAISIF